MQRVKAFFLCTAGIAAVFYDNIHVMPALHDSKSCISLPTML